MCLVFEFLEFLELGDCVFNFGFLNFWNFQIFWEFLELGDGVFSFGCFAILKCGCILWNLCWLKRSWKHKAPAQFSEQLQICHTYSARFWNFGNVDL